MIYWCLSTTHSNFNISATLRLISFSDISSLFWKILSLSAIFSETDNVVSTCSIGPCCQMTCIIPFKAVLHTYWERNIEVFYSPASLSSSPASKLYENIMCATDQSDAYPKHRVCTSQYHLFLRILYSLFLKQFIPLCRAVLSSFLLFLPLSLRCALLSLMCFDLSHVNYSDIIHADVCVYNWSEKG